MSSSRRLTLTGTCLVAGLWLMLTACEAPFDPAAAGPSPSPSAPESTEPPGPSPTPSAGNVQPIITF